MTRKTNKGVMISCKWSEVFLEFNIELNRKNKIQKWSKACKASKKNKEFLTNQLSKHAYNDIVYSVKECK